MESSSRRKRRQRALQRRRRRQMIFGCVAVGFIFLLIMFMSSCGVSHSSPTKVVESLIRAYGKQSESQVLDCYDQKGADESLTIEVRSMMAYIEAHNPQGLEIEKSGILSRDGNTALVYIVYHLELESKQAYPCLGTYVTRKNGGSYYVIPPNEITEEMQYSAAKNYKKFMTTATYKKFQRDYNTFVKKNPGYQDRISVKLGEQVYTEEEASPETMAE